MSMTLKILAAVLAMSYPLAVFLGLSLFEPRYLALYLCVVVLLRFSADKAGRAMFSGKLAVFIVAIGILLTLFTMSSNSLGGLKFYPVIVSFSILATFVVSLIYPPSAIERIARLREPDLPQAGVEYTRKVTKIWCVFLLCNGLAALYTSLYSSVEVWTLYNGLISYLLMGCLLGGEMIYRSFVLKPTTKPSNPEIK